MVSKNNRLKGKSPEEIKELYELFLSDSSRSGLTSNVSNYRNAHLKDEIRQVLKEISDSESLYNIIDISLLEKAISHLATTRQKFKGEKSIYKRYKDCGSYLKKYISFIEAYNKKEMTIDSSKNQDKKSTIGFCYIITNPSFKSNLLKIGYTDSLERRLNDLYTTSVPKRFEVFAALKTSKYKEAEELMHKAFDDARISPDREFFQLLRDDALEYLKSIAKALGGELILFDKNGNPKKPIKY